MRSLGPPAHNKVDEDDDEFHEDGHESEHNDGASQEVEIMAVQKYGNGGIGESDKDERQGHKDRYDKFALAVASVGDLAHGHEGYDNQGNVCDEVQGDADLGSCRGLVGAGRRGAAGAASYGEDEADSHQELEKPEMHGFQSAGCAILDRVDAIHICQSMRMDDVVK